jgi:hypothetical protein
MPPELKPYSIPDFNPLPMKTIQLLTLTFFSLIFSYSCAQNLQFNSAVFYEYGGGMANSSSGADVVTTGTITVASNQVLKITQVGGSIGAPDFGTNCFNLTGGIVLINDKCVGFMNTNGTIAELYLPTGTYSVGFTDGFNVTAQCTGEVKGYISGVLYDIVP